MDSKEYQSREKFEELIWEKRRAELEYALLMPSSEVPSGAFLRTLKAYIEQENPRI